MLVFFVSITHLLWGILILVNQGPIQTAATSVFAHFVPIWQLRAICYIVSALLPLTLLRWPGSVIGLLSAVPQQSLLIMSGISAIVAISSGMYADGTVRSPIFIGFDQGIYILLSVFHAKETFDRYHERGSHE